MIKVEVKSSLMEVTHEFEDNKKCLAYLNRIKRHHDKHNTGANAFLKINITEN
jgi:hypothetical protein